MRTLAALALAVALALPAASPAAEASGLPLQPARHVAFDTDEATWLSLDVAPDGRSVVLEILGDLYVLDARGGQARRITSGMAFDSQPVFSPDGSRIAFVSDRSGAENIWTARPDGSDPRQLTRQDLPHEYVSPAWSPDGRQIYASLYRADRNATELWRFPVAGGAGEELTERKFNALGARPSPDGRYLYYAMRSGPVFEDDVVLPLWSIHRRDLKSGDDVTLVTNQGSAMRPVPSPDGRLLAYAARIDGRTILRLRDLETGADRILADPITHDAQESTASRDLVPGYAFTPDSRAVVTTVGGRIARIDVLTGAKSAVPFTAHVALDIGPQLRQRLNAAPEQVRARLIQQPVQSPDGRTLAFSALGRVYTMELTGGAGPKPLSEGGAPQYMPAWSPDGRSLAYVTWTADGGGVWIGSPAHAAKPRRVDSAGAYYTNPVFTPDGRALMVLRSSAYDRLHTAQEPLWTGRSFGPLRQAELVEIPLDGGSPRVLASGPMSGDPHFTADPGAVFVNTGKGLERVARDGSGHEVVLQVNGPGYYFLEDEVDADEIRLSPDGRFALVQANQQLHLIEAPKAGSKDSIDLSRPAVRHRALTSVGADFFGWADGGRTVTWAVGSTFYRRPVSSIALDPAGRDAGPADRPAPGKDGVEAFQAVVERPPDIPAGTIVLRGATVVTMHGDEVIPDADVVVTANRIVAVGPRGKVAVPSGAAVRDVSGKWIIPGLIDVHDHFGEVRRGVLEFPDWGLEATLAYGVTSALDPSTLSIDMLAYEDLIDAGEMKGPRLFNTATAIFSYNRLKSLGETRDLVSRYVEHYRTRNVKLYRTGNRTQRQWVVMAAHDLGAMPVAEGALDAKLDLTQLIDGISGNEHALGIVPLYDDVVQLIVRLRASYDLTLQISHGGPPAGADFIIRDRPHGDPKIAAFYPHFIRDKLYTRARWVDRQELSYPAAAEGAAAIQRAGGLVAVGSHGNYPGVGYHWELQAYAAGGMTPREVLTAATIGSAETIGRLGELGSLEPGKLADLLVLSKDPLADVHNLLAIDQVMKNGRIYDGPSLDEVWPRQEPPSRPWWVREDAQLRASR
jgi:Tol biopolymer transport system component